ncbi:MAG TPA: hypothetical protein VN108_00045 [Marmoricola sp.]|nr:hypothetical protein [Marmoricola sp.]
MRTTRLVVSVVTLVLTVTIGAVLLALGVLALSHGDSHGVAGVVFGCLLFPLAGLDIFVIRLLTRRPATPGEALAEPSPPV